MFLMSKTIYSYIGFMDYVMVIWIPISLKLPITAMRRMHKTRQDHDSSLIRHRTLQAVAYGRSTDGGGFPGLLQVAESKKVN